MTQKIEKICKYTILIIWGIIIFYLTFLSMRGTSVEAVRNIAPIDEEPIYSSYVYYLLDNPWRHILYISLFLLFCVIIKKIILCLKEKNVRRIDFHSPKITFVLLIVFMIIGIFYIMNTQLEPKSDPQKLQIIAKEMLRGDFHQFNVGEYMYRYPFQSGFLLTIYYVMRFFGDKTYLVLQLINVIAVAGIYFSVYKIVNIIWSKKSNFIVILEIIFIPMVLYTTFVYGNILSFCIAMYAIYFEYEFFLNKKIFNAFFSAVLISFSIILKSNSLIILCAMMLYACYNLIFKEKKEYKIRMMLYIVLVFAFYIISSNSVEAHMESIVGTELSKGMPKSAWVAMGLEDSEIAPGHWNGTSVNLYIENNFDYDKTNQAAFENIENRIKKYVEDWRLGLDFFGRKIAAEWNEPTFQGFSITQGRKAEIIIPEWIQNLYEGKGSIYLANILNVLQSWVYFGVCLYIIIRFKKSSMDELIFALIMIGGFIFQLFWEGKSKYVMNYFFLLIPYAAIGYQLIVDKLCNLICVIKNEPLIFSAKKIGIGFGTILFIVVSALLIGRHITGMKTYQYTLGVRSSDELLEEYNAMLYK